MNPTYVPDLIAFQAHGYATDEFEVTEERLGVYLPVGGSCLAFFLGEASSHIVDGAYR
jgi:hypothetical protein